MQINQELFPNNVGNPIPEQNSQESHIVDLKENVIRLTDQLAKQGNDRDTIEGLLGPTWQTHSFCRSGASKDGHTNVHANGDSGGHTHSRMDEIEDTPDSNARGPDHDISDDGDVGDYNTSITILVA